MKTQIKKITCECCGADFDEMLPKCPYCDSTNLKGAEAAYMEKLEDVRSDMEDLAQIPVRETKKELKKQTKLIACIIGILLIVFAILVVVELIYGGFGEDMSQQEKQEEYLWKQENYAKFDDIFEQGNDDTLLNMYYQAVSEGKPVFEWEHSDYCTTVARYKDMEYIWAKLERNENETSLGVEEYAELLNGYFVIEYYYNEFSDEERERYQPYYEIVKKDYEARWDFQGEEWEAVEKERKENYGFVSYKTGEAYVRAWLERQEKE